MSRQKIAIVFRFGIWHNQNMNNDSSDRRRRLRVPLESRIRHSLYQAAGTPVQEDNSAVDLSSSGVSFETRRAYSQGALVLLEMFLAGGTLKLLVCIAWVKPLPGGVFQVGAEVVAIDPQEKQKMLDHLEAVLVRSRSTTRRTKKKVVRKKKASAKKKRIRKISR